jgi:SIR2-like protein
MQALDRPIFVIYRQRKDLSKEWTLKMHDLQRIRQDLEESLSLDKHPVALLLGAGCPVAVRVPDGSGGTSPLIADIAGLTNAAKSALSADPSFAKILKQFTEDGRVEFTIEDLLSQVRLLARVCGAGDARGLKENDLRELEAALCKHIAEAVRKDLPDDKTPYHRLADWVGGISRKSPLNVFTTNYDVLFEQALEERGLPYFDGFVGGRRPFFDLRAIEDDKIPPRWTLLWKLHGSISWRLLPDGLVIRDFKTDGSDGLLIHPSEQKYDQSRRMPYLAMIDRLRSFLRQPSAFLATIGYSYADQHLNEILDQGLRSNPTAAVFGLLYKNIADEAGAIKIAGKLPMNFNLLARDKGVVRGTLGAWLPGSASPTENNLGDFARFAELLANLRSVSRSISVA